MSLEAKTIKKLTNLLKYATHNDLIAMCINMISTTSLNHLTNSNQ